VLVIFAFVNSDVEIKETKKIKFVKGRLPEHVLLLRLRSSFPWKLESLTKMYFVEISKSFDNDSFSHLHPPTHLIFISI